MAPKKSKAKSPKITPRAAPRASSGLSRDTQAMMMFESNKKSVTTAFLLWFFTGMFGGHRFYLGKTGTAILMILFTITLFGAIITAIWGIIDAFRIPGLIREHNNRLAQSLNQNSDFIVI